MEINNKKENGYAVLFIVIIVNAAALVIVTSIMIWGFYFHKTSLAQLKSVQASGLANACAEHALQQIRDDENYTGTQNLNIGDGSCSYAVAGTSPNKTIQVTGIVDEATRKISINIDQINPTINLSSWQEVADLAGPGASINPIAAWKIDKGEGKEIIDSSGNKYNGKIKGAEWKKIDGKMALYFDGKDDFIEIPDSKDMKLDKEVSFEAWIKTDNNITAKIVEKGDWDGHGMGQDRWNGWRTNYFIDKKGYSVKWENGVPSAKEWYYMVSVFDGETILLYINGKIANKLPVKGELYKNSRNVFIGSNEGKQKFFNGYIDEVSIYNEALSEEEIKEKYNNKDQKTKYEIK